MPFVCVDMHQHVKIGINMFEHAFYVSTCINVY